MNFKVWLLAGLAGLAFLAACNGSSPDSGATPATAYAAKFLGSWQHPKYALDKVQITADAEGQFDVVYSASNMMGGIQTRRAKAVLEKNSLVDHGVRVAQILDNGHLVTEGREYVRLGTQ